MGNIVSLLTSLRIMIGVPLLGSIIKPLILTSISIKTLNLLLKHLHYPAVETMRFRLRHEYPQDFAYLSRAGREIDDFITGRMPREIAFRSGAEAFGQHFDDFPNI